MIERMFLLAVLAGLGTSACSDGGAAAEGAGAGHASTDNDVGTIEQAAAGGYDFFANQRAVAAGDGMLCGAITSPDPVTGLQVTDTVSCFMPTPTGHTPMGNVGFYIHWTRADHRLPGGDVKSMVVSAPRLTDAAVFVLGSDSKVRVATGHLSNNTHETWYTGTNFKTVTDYMAATDVNGSLLCLRQIAEINLPSRFAPSRDLVALSCSGALYVRRASNGRWVWTRAADAGQPWNSLPAGSWLQVTHGPLGAYLLSSTKKVLLMATGTTSASGAVTYTAPRWLPLVGPPPAMTLVSIGGRFALYKGIEETCGSLSCSWDASRVWRWDGSAYRASVAAQNADNEGVPPWRGILDAVRYRGSQSSFGLDHEFSRLYLWDP